MTPSRRPAILFVVGVLLFAKICAPQQLSLAVNNNGSVTVTAASTDTSPLALLPQWRDHFMGSRSASAGISDALGDLIDARLVLFTTGPVSAPLPLCAAASGRQGACVVPGAALVDEVSGATGRAPMATGPELTVAATGSTSGTLTASGIAANIETVEVTWFLMGDPGNAELELSRLNDDLSVVERQSVTPQNGNIDVAASNLTPYSWHAVVAQFLSAGGVGTQYSVATMATPAGETTDIEFGLAQPRAGRLVIFMQLAEPFTSPVTGASATITNRRTSTSFSISLPRPQAIFGPQNQTGPLTITILYLGTTPFTRYSVEARILGPGGVPSSSVLTGDALSPPQPQPTLLLSWQIGNSSVGTFFWTEQQAFGASRVHTVQVLGLANNVVLERSCGDTCTSIQFSIDELRQANARRATARVVNSAGPSEPSPPIPVTLPPVEEHSDSSTNLGVAIGVPLAIFLIVAIAIAFYVRRSRKRLDESHFVPPEPGEMELPRAHVKLMASVASGEFGVVYRGLLSGLQTGQEDGRCLQIQVAVKACEDIDLKRMNDFVKEMDLMQQISAPQHPNVVAMLGMCTQELPMLCVLEWADGGSLWSFVQDLDPENSGGPNRITHDHVSIISACLSDVASGMHYLSLQHGLIHRDIAARNVLLFEDIQDDRPVAKVADFGLSKTSLHGTSITVRGEDRLPVRWMAPEAIEHQCFDVYTDVYSFGVLIWECFSYGTMPYPDLINSAVAGQVLSGRTLTAPDLCPPAIGQLMRRCLSRERDDRPTFEELHDSLFSHSLAFKQTPHTNYVSTPRLRRPPAKVYTQVVLNRASLQRSAVSEV